MEGGGWKEEVEVGVSLEVKVEVDEDGYTPN
jgi:hypothetical protein